jgi:hypothetical protein
MIKKFFALTLALLFVLNLSAFAQTRKSNSNGNTKTITAVQTNKLVASLPASDGAMFVDVQQLLNDALPQLFAGNPEKLSEINQHIDAIREKTGLDVRQFEQIAVGINLTTNAAGKNTVDPVVLARGKYNSDALLTLAKIALKGKFREEKAGGKSIYVFAAKEILTEHKAKITNNAPNKMFDFLLRKMPAEIAVSALDANTLAIGSIARVREVFESKSRLSAETAALLNRKPNSLMSFGASTPTGLKQFFALDEDMLGQSLGAIRQIYGSVSMSGGNIFGLVGAKSLNAEQAKSLEETLVGFQALGKSFLGSARSEQKQALARIVENAKITRTGTEVSIDMQVANTDVALFIK